MNFKNIGMLKWIFVFAAVFALTAFRKKTSISDDVVKLLLKMKVHYAEDAHFNLLGTDINLLDTRLSEDYCNEGNSSFDRF